MVSQYAVKVCALLTATLTEWSFIPPEMYRFFLSSRIHTRISLVDCVWNVMAHAQKPDIVFRRNGRVHLNRRGASVRSTTGSRVVRISGSNAGYTMFRGSVKSTGYPLHSPVSPSLPLPCVTVCHHISTGLYFYDTVRCVIPVVCVTNEREENVVNQHN